MKVVFAGVGWSFEYAGGELRDGFVKILSEITLLASSFGETCNSPKTLVVIRSCPCCGGSLDLMSYEGDEFIMVSPLTGIDKAGYEITTPEVYPPFRNPGKDRECKTTEVFLEAWKKTIENALKKAKVSTK